MALLEDETRADYGSQNRANTAKRFTKYYSTIFPAEIINDKQEGNLKFIQYKGGDAYSAPMVDIKTI